MIRVVIVDDSELMRRGLALLLGTADQVDVVGEAADGREALAVVAKVSPDVVLTDAQMPVLDGVGLVGELSRTHPGLPVVVLTTFDDDPVVRAAMAAGAAGFLLKSTSIDGLLQALNAAASGGLVLDPRVARAAFAAQPSRDAGPLAALTRTERLVAAEVATGAPNAEIAARMVLAEGTVKNHVSALLRKLGQRDRTALALLLARYL